MINFFNLFLVSDCPENFPDKNLKKEPEEMTQALTSEPSTSKLPNTCLRCNMTFVRTVDFLRHEKLHKNKKSFKCNQCDKIYTRKSKLIAHEKIHANENQEISNDRSLENNKINLNQQSYIVGKKLNNELPVINQSLPDQIYSKIIETNIKRFSCDLCNKTYVRKDRFILHKESHNEKQFQCKICNKVFQKQNELHQHEKFHIVLRSFQCTSCDMSFKHEINFIKHLKIHGRNLYSKTTERNKDLILHKEIYNKEKFFQCDICDKTYSSKNSLNRHKKIHQRYGLNETNGLFSKNNKTANKQSETIKQSWKCDICNKTFTRRYNLNVHKESHKIEKKFKCDHCNESFLLYEYLETHKRIHAPLKQFNI